MSDLDVGQIAAQLDAIEEKVETFANDLASEKTTANAPFINGNSVNPQDLSLGDTLKVGMSMQKYPQLTETKQVAANKYSELQTANIQKIFRN